MTLKNRNGEKDITSIQNESLGHPQEPPGHENHHMATAALDISKIFKAMYTFDLK